MKLTRKGVTASILSVLLTTGAVGMGLWHGLPIVGQPAFCTSTVSGVTLPANQGPYGVVPGSTQGSGQGICGETTPAGPPVVTGSELVPADTALPNAAPPQTVRIPTALLANMSGTPRNYLDNGALNITNANGTSTVTGQINAAAAVATNLAADRWLLSTNVGSGAGRSAIVTSSPSPPTGFTNVMKVFRTSGALTQPICVWQEIPTPQATQLAGQTVTLSAYAAALAGLNADNNNQMQLVIITGTGTDQGFGSWTASPAITPAWTGIATPLNAVQNVTTTFARYSATVTLASTVTEAAAGLCFTPTATGAGATDGFAWTGAQLEIAPSPTAFEVLKKQDEIVRAQQFLVKISEGALGPVRAQGWSATTSLVEGLLQLPVPMYSAPTMTYTAGFAACTTVTCGTYSACVALRTSTAQASTATVNTVPIECTSAAAFSAAGTPQFIADNGGSGVITAWAGM
jgi:hypothetical protein